MDMVAGETKTGRAEQRERSRTRILESAVRLFAERGYEGVRLDEIASAADVKRSLILYYFNSKDELWRCAAKQVSAAFNAAMHAKIAKARGSSPVDALRATIAASLDAFLEEPDFAKFMVREGGMKGPRVDWLVAHFAYAEVGYGGPELQEYVGKTILRDVLFSIFLSMAALGPLMEASLSRVSRKNAPGVHPMTRKNKDELVSHLVRLITSIEAV